MCLSNSVTALEITGLFANIHSLVRHLLAHTHFDHCVDHLAVIQILKSKAMPAYHSISRLLECFLSIALTYTILKARINSE